MAGGYIEWCYVCGAVRKLTVVRGNGPLHSVPGTTWVRPTGSKDNNPYAKLKSRFGEDGLEPVKITA